MNVKPKVLIFDDQKDWADQIALTLNKFSTTTISNPDHWNKTISSTHWDAIIVDVQILGDSLDGPERAEQSILDFGIVTPIIIISGVVNLEDVKKKYGDIFFEYIHKDNYNKDLPHLVENACNVENRYYHMINMLTELAKKFKVLNHTFPKDMILDNVVLQLFESGGGK
ncbi:MAG: response regulator, partial [Thaumarchaeota archaeon]|nr:response regulator [Nitrososphaerota archaeon]